MRRSKALALVFLLGTLIVGGAVGFTVDRMLVRGMCQKSSLHEYLAEQLALTPAQRSAVDSILEKRHRDWNAAYAPVRPKMDSIRIAAREEIFKLLNAEQSRRFQQIIEESQREEAKKK